MKKYLVFLMMVSSMLMMSSEVIALNQNIEATVTEMINLSILPDILVFSDLIPGSATYTPSNAPITFTAGTGSNANTITVEFTSVTTNGLFELMEVEIVPPTFIPITTVPKPSIQMSCNLIGGVCSYNPVTVNAQLKAPQGYPSGTKTGVITYTITGT